MLEQYDAHGVRFQYPSDWELNEHQQEQEISITIESGETSFWSLSLYLDRPHPEHVVETAVQAFREEYDDLDIYPANITLCRQQTVSRDLEFVCLELINSAFLRSFQTGRFTALVFYQGTDHELESTQETLEAISRSLECDNDEDALLF